MVHFPHRCNECACSEFRKPVSKHDTPDFLEGAYLTAIELAALSAVEYHHAHALLMLDSPFDGLFDRDE